MKIDIKKLMKKRKDKTLTGKELGQLDIYYTATAYKRMLLKEKPLYPYGRIFNDEIASYIDRPGFTERDKMDLFEYGQLKGCLADVTVHLAYHAQVFESTQYKLQDMLKTVLRAEKEYQMDAIIPFYYTDKAYKGEDFRTLQDQERARKYSPFMIILETIQEMINQKYPGIDPFLKAVFKEKVTNQRILDIFHRKEPKFVTEAGQEEQDILPAVWYDLSGAKMLKKVQASRPKEVDKFTTLINAGAWYNPEETRIDYEYSPKANMIREFKKDFPDIYEFTLNRLATNPLLKPIKKMNQKDLIRPTFTGGELARAGLDLYINKIKDPYFYKYQELRKVEKPYAEDFKDLIEQARRMPNRRFLSECLLNGDTAQAVKEYQDTIREELASVMSFKIYVQLIEQTLNMDYIHPYYSICIERVTRRIEKLNALFKRIHLAYRDGRIPGEMNGTELRYYLNQTFPIIELEKFTPPEPYYSKLKKSFTISTAIRNAISLANKIAGEIESNMQ